MYGDIRNGSTSLIVSAGMAWLLKRCMLQTWEYNNKWHDTQTKRDMNIRFDRVSDHHRVACLQRPGAADQVECPPYPQFSPAK
jgi:hypothetical protein